MHSAWHCYVIYSIIWFWLYEYSYVVVTIADAFRMKPIMYVVCIYAR